MDRPAPGTNHHGAFDPGPVTQEGRIGNIDVHGMNRSAFITGHVVLEGDSAEGQVRPDERVIGQVDRTTVTGVPPLGGRFAVSQAHEGEGDLAQLPG